MVALDADFGVFEQAACRVCKRLQLHFIDVGRQMLLF
jgi:hypothetical protein